MSESLEGVKRPSDHKPKAAKKPKKGDVIAVEIRGVALDVPTAALDDFELLDLLGQAESESMTEEDAVLLPGALRRLVGPAYRKLLAAVRDPETGRVPIKEGIGLIGEVLQAVGEAGGETAPKS